MPHVNVGGSHIVLAEGLGKSFATTTAVEDLTLSIAAGEVFGLLGPSGAGKSTALQMLAGRMKPTTGRVLINGLDASDPAHARQLRSITGFLPGGPLSHPEMSVPELLDYFARLQQVLGPEQAARIEAILTTLDLWEGQSGRAADRSAGLRQRLALARALTHNPSVVFLDEPTTGLSPEGAGMVHELITDLRTQGHTVVLTLRGFREAERLCDRVAVLNTRVLTVGIPARLHGTLPVGI